MIREHRRSRSRSPILREESQGQRHQRSRPSDHRREHQIVSLPRGAHELSKHDLSKYRPLFALYLDIKKQLDIEDLEEIEIKGRWKRFIGKWNRGELSDSWYDPGTLTKAQKAALPDDSQTRDRGRSESDDDDYGPALPSQAPTKDEHQQHERRRGPTIPSIEDIKIRREQAEEDAIQEREDYVEHIRRERRSERDLEKERLNELVPRAEPGTRERQLEKKREQADSNRAFAASKDGGDVELRDAEVMGDEDSLGMLKRMQKENEKKRTEREIRREEALRARRAEREERMAGLRQKEDKTMAMLKEIAKARFGSG